MAGAEDFDADVLIVGGGPVGLGLAIELGQRGQRCVVVERYESVNPIPRGQNLTQRTMEHFHFWGIEKELRAARTVPPEYGIGGLTAYGTLLGEYTYDWLQRELVKPYYFTDNERLPQYATETVLRTRAAEIPEIELKLGWRAEQIDQDADGVSVSIAARESGKEQSLRARYLVGCDGARSVVREQAQISQTRSDHDRRMVLLVFKSEQLHELLKRYHGKSFFNVLHPDLQGYWRFFGRVDLGSTWFFHAPVPAETTKDNFDFNACLHEAVGVEFDLEIQHIGFWDLRIAVADDYRAGRIFIAGDAAHSHPPYGAFGINTGFEDARNLGWKLAAVLDGQAGSDILDTYQEERRPVFVSTAHNFIETVIENDRDFLNTYDPVANASAFEREWARRASGTAGEVDSFEPNYAGSSIVWGADGASCNAIGPHSFDARAGHHIAPQNLSSGESIYSALGQGFTLFAFDVEHQEVDQFRVAADRLKFPLDIVTDSFDDDRLKLEKRFILVRPDQFVAWADNELSCSPEEILARASGAK